MKTELQKEITKISKSFAKGFKSTLEIHESGWFIIDPLSAYLNAMGYKNTLTQLPETKERSLTLIITFKDGSQFIPGGLNLKSVHPKAKNWMWI